MGEAIGWLLASILNERIIANSLIDGRQCSPLSLALDELLPDVDVVGGAGEGRVRHDMYGERGHVGWADHAADRQSAAQLLATRVYLISKEGRRQWCVDEAALLKALGIPGGEDKLRLPRRALVELWFAPARRGGCRQPPKTQSETSML
jgi:hypothetical protein